MIRENKGLVLGTTLIVLLVAFDFAPTGSNTVDDPATDGSGEATGPQQSNADGDDPTGDWALIADGYTPGRGGGGCPTGESYCPTAWTPADATDSGER